jgi:nucleoside-diphosphate-sugar epimerase
LVADAARLTALSGWRPETTLGDGLGLCVEWWRERIAGGRQRRDSGYAR